MARGIRRTNTDPGWIGRRFRRIERELQELRSAKNLQAASVGAGGVTVRDGGDFQILDADGNVVFSAKDGPIRTWWQQGDLPATTFPDGGWNEYLVAVIPVPLGYSTAIVQLFVSAGGTFTSSGNVGVQPSVDGAGGPGLSNGISSGPCSVNSSMAYSFDVAGRDSFNISAFAIRNGPVTTGSNNVHLSASVIFIR